MSLKQIIVGPPESNIKLIFDIVMTNLIAYWEYTKANILVYINISDLQ